MSNFFLLWHVRLIFPFIPILNRVLLISPAKMVAGWFDVMPRTRYKLPVKHLRPLLVPYFWCRRWRLFFFYGISFFLYIKFHLKETEVIRREWEKEREWGRIDRVGCIWQIFSFPLFSLFSLAIFAPSLIFSSFTLNLLNIFPLHFHPLLQHYVYHNVTKRSYQDS